MSVSGNLTGSAAKSYMKYIVAKKERVNGQKAEVRIQDACRRRPISVAQSAPPSRALEARLQAAYTAADQVTQMAVDQEMRNMKKEIGDKLGDAITQINVKFKEAD